MIEDGEEVYNEVVKRAEQARDIIWFLLKVVEKGLHYRIIIKKVKRDL